MLFTRTTLVLIISHICLEQFAQVDVKGPWTFELGASTNTAFREPASINIRYISPRFKWSEEFNEDEEKYPDIYRNTRMMVELIYKPPKEVIAAGFNVQSRLLGTKRFSLNVYGGLKFFIIPGPDFIRVPYLKMGREIWYMSMGLITQFNLGAIAPFIDIGGDKIITVGTEFNFHKIYRKTKRRYNLKQPQT